MQDGFFSNLNPGLKLLFSLLLITITFLAIFLGGMLVGMFIFDVSLAELQNIKGDSTDVSLLKYLQTLQAFGLFIIPSLILAYLFKFKWYEYLQLNKAPNIISLLIVFVLVIVSLPFINFLAEFNSKMNLPEMFSGIENWMKQSEKDALAMTEKFLKVETIGGLLFNIFLIGVLPAIGEELLFRGIVQKIFIEWTKNHHIGIIISAIIFSAFHLQFYGFLPRLLLGMMFGYFLVWSKSMWLPIIAHFINNTLAVLTYYFVNKGSISEDVETIGSKGNTLFYAILSLIFMSILLYNFYSYEKRLNS